MMEQGNFLITFLILVVVKPSQKGDAMQTVLVTTPGYQEQLL